MKNKKISTVVSMMLTIIVATITNVGATEKKITVPCLTVFNQEAEKKVGMKTTCIDGYKFLVAVTLTGGVSVTQMFVAMPGGEITPDLCKK